MRFCAFSETSIWHKNEIHPGYRNPHPTVLKRPHPVEPSDALEVLQRKEPLHNAHKLSFREVAATRARRDRLAIPSSVRTGNCRRNARRKTPDTWPSGIWCRPDREAWKINGSVSELPPNWSASSRPCREASLRRDAASVNRWRCECPRRSGEGQNMG